MLLNAMQTTPSLYDLLMLAFNLCLSLSLSLKLWTRQCSCHSKPRSQMLGLANTRLFFAAKPSNTDPRACQHQTLRRHFTLCVCVTPRAALTTTPYLA